MRKETSVLIYYSRFATVIGGGEYRPLLLAAEFQKRGCAVTMAVIYDTLIVETAERYGIELDTNRLKIVQIKPKGKFGKKVDSVLPIYAIQRLKALAKNADICISAQNIIDFGKPAHHLICDIRQGQFGDTAFCDYAHRCSYGPLRKLCRIVRYWLANSLLRPMFGIRPIWKIVADRREHLYPNSVYVDNLMRGFYGEINSTIFYPPTTFSNEVVVVRRDPYLVTYIGRINPEKRIETIIDIVDRARRLSGKDLKLDIAGMLTDSWYSAEIKRRASQTDWVRLKGFVYGPEKMDFLARGTYAIHAERDEAFGISITEYLKAGSIAIVPDEGGTKEIVDSPALTYASEDEAAQILARLLSDDTFREEMHRHCQARAEMFTREADMERQREFVDNLLESLPDR